MSFPHGLRSKPLDLAEEAGEVAGMELALDLGSGPHALAPELDEARRRRLVEGVALAVGGEGELVELLRALSADDLGGAPVKLEADVAGDVALGLRDERVKSVAERAEPEAVVDPLAPLLGDAVLEPGNVLGRGDDLQSLTGLVKQHGRGVF